MTPIVCIEEGRVPYVQSITLDAAGILLCARGWPETGYAVINHVDCLKKLAADLVAIVR